MSQQSISTLKTAINLLFTEDVKAPDLQSQIINLIDSLENPIPHPEITAFTGAAGIETIATIDLALNTKVEVVIGGILYTLVLERPKSSGEYYTPNDYHADTNNKKWRQANEVIVAFSDSDLEAGKYTFEFTHGRGKRYPFVNVIDPNNKKMEHVYESPVANQYSINYYSVDRIDVIFHSSMSGNHKLILTF